MNRIFQTMLHIPGTLSADIATRHVAPCDCTLLHVSAVASNNSDATLEIGTGTDADAFLAATVIGDAGTPMAYGRTDFVGHQFPRIVAGDVVAVALDHDGDGGTAAANVTLVLTFAEG